MLARDYHANREIDAGRRISLAFQPESRPYRHRTGAPMDFRDRHQGFTLVELMVALAVLAILTIAAVPSFSTFRQRSVVREASEQALGFWNQVRFEAVKRNALVNVGVMIEPDGSFCLGAATTLDPSAASPCDCSSASPASNVCDVARYPDSQQDWNDVRIESGEANVVIEPKRGGLATPGSAGVFVGLSAPDGPMDYTINLHVDALGRAVLCQSAADANAMSDYEGRRCAP